MSSCLQTGQTTCHDSTGREIPCAGSGQDAEFNKGIPSPTPRYDQNGETVLDRLTGLVWSQNAGIVEFPVTWQEALDFIAEMNRDEAFGHSDWRLPNRRELRSLMSHQTRKPVLPEGHPFLNVFSGWYWTSTTAAVNTAYAWYVHMGGGRLFYGGKEQFFLLWPVRGRGYDVLPATGQTACYDSNGNTIPCARTGQDGEAGIGAAWPIPRFEPAGDEVVDRLTGLRWRLSADLTGRPVTWSEALSLVHELGLGWRIPNINELESLVDCSMYSPALPQRNPFINVRDGYWSSTTSMFEPDWAWALYVSKGAVGVGQKRGAYFYIWPVRD